VQDEPSPHFHNPLILRLVLALSSSLHLSPKLFNPSFSSTEFYVYCLMHAFSMYCPSHSPRIDSPNKLMLVEELKLHSSSL
jgi:hypothetical protein